MGILSIGYVAFGYLSLLMALLWGMLFFGDRTVFPNMDAAAAASSGAVPIDLALLAALAVLHRTVTGKMLQRFTTRAFPKRLERATQAWLAAAGLAFFYGAWQPLPQALWVAPAPLVAALSGLFYIAWTLIMIGAFLAAHLELFDAIETTRVVPHPTLNQPLYAGILIALWASSVMTVGRLLVAASVTIYVLLDALWTAHKTAVTRASRETYSIEAERVAS